MKSQSRRGSKGISLDMVDMEDKWTEVETSFNIFIGLISLSIDPVKNVFQIISGSHLNPFVFKGSRVLEQMRLLIISLEPLTPWPLESLNPID
jgi:hypothetical protein